MKSFLVKLKEIKDFILDLVFPKECLGCGQEKVYLCPKCFNEIDSNKKFYCALCKQEHFLSKICSQCQKDTFLSYIWVAGDYNNQILEKLIHNLKYKFVEEISQILAQVVIKYIEVNQLFQILQINSTNTLILAVPLHEKRFLKRGFNQSDLIADKISNYFKIEKKDWLRRKSNTQSQIRLSRKERQENVKDAFGLIDKDNYPLNKKIIIIDDVLTTGSTLKECAKVLHNQGYTEIYGLVVAQRED